MEFVIGSDIVGSYRRLPYKAWYAIAEFVDNSTQSYFDHKQELDEVYIGEDKKLTVSIVYENGLLRVFDNAMGMSYAELEGALHVAQPPKDTSGRSRYGLGLKTAAFWLGNEWSIRTKKLGEITEHRVTVLLKEIMSGNQDVHHEERVDRSKEEHYTIIEVKQHNHQFKGRTLGKIKDFLRSIYREDLRGDLLSLQWRGQDLTWEDPVLLENRQGEEHRRDFEFTIDDKNIYGWVGILERGSRAKAGFSVLQAGRVIKGWPNAWRPRELYGQEEGSNDLVNQRLVGEIHLDGFEVSHTKDDIQWFGDQEERVEALLLKHCGELRNYAREHRKREQVSAGPSDAATETAIDELKRELESPQMVDHIDIQVIPTDKQIEQSFDQIVESVTVGRQETFSINISNLLVTLYVVDDMSPNDPYVVSEPSKNQVIVIVNRAHPHWVMLSNDEVQNYLRHCTYDAVAEWQAKSIATSIHPETIRKLKDSLLRVPFEIEQDQGYNDSEEGSNNE